MSYPVTQIDTEAIRARVQWVQRVSSGDDAQFIANARTDIPALLAALESARGLAARLEAELAHAAPSVLQDDVRDLLLACGLGDYARPYSPHEVVQREVLPAIHLLREGVS